MKWKKLGRIFVPDGNVPWAQSHAAVPIVKHIDGDLYRVYFAGRDLENRSRVGFLDFDVYHPQKIINLQLEAVLDLGSLGSFDDCGVLGSWIVDHQGQSHLFYCGLTRGQTVPFFSFIGHAVRENNSEKFERSSLAPFIDRSAADPYLVTLPCLRLEEGVWKMWYVSCTGWEVVNGNPKHHYHIKYTESLDLLRWNREATVAIDFQPGEHAIARPCVLIDSDMYRMWYCYRGNSYRIGYAESPDGVNWKRKDDQVGIAVSEDGWDSQMLAYPFVFDHKGDRFMMYNGNAYGKTGVGLAVLEQSN